MKSINHFSNQISPSEAIKMFLHSYSKNMRSSLSVIKGIVNQIKDEQRFLGNNNLSVVLGTVNGMDNNIERLKQHLEKQTLAFKRLENANFL